MGPSGAQRLHQEDFCQASGITSAFKCQADGGPGFKVCFDLLRRVATVPAKDIGRMLSAVVLNVILGNADAHAKNFSLLYGQGSTCLAPLYDLLSTPYHQDLAADSAMKIGDASTLEDLNQKEWRDFAGKVGIGFPIIRSRVGELVESVPAAIPGVVASLAGAGLDDAVLDRLAVLVQERAERCGKKI
jgi:serine/threonine-protein kinase HipA